MWYHISFRTQKQALQFLECRCSCPSSLLLSPRFIIAIVKKFQICWPPALVRMRTVEQSLVSPRSLAPPLLRSMQHFSAQNWILCACASLEERRIFYNFQLNLKLFWVELELKFSVGCCNWPLFPRPRIWVLRYPTLLGLQDNSSSQLHCMQKCNILQIYM